MKSSVAKTIRGVRLGTIPVAVVTATMLAVVGGAQAGSPGSRGHDIEQKLGQKRGAIAAAKAKEEQLSAQIAAQSAQIDTLQSGVRTLATQVAGLERELSRARRRLAAIERRLAEQRAELERLRHQLAVAQRRLSQRLVQLYESDEPDVTEIVLGAADLEGLMEQIDANSRIADQDERLATEFRSARDRTDRARRRTEALRAAQATKTAVISDRAATRRAAYSSLVAERDRLASARSDRRRSLASIQVEQKNWESEADALEAESARLAAIAAAPPLARPAAPAAPAATAAPSNEAPAAAPSVEALSSSGFVWPVQGTLVSPFGMRWGRLHAGIDIAAPAGTPIAAAASGTVSYAGSMSGYGLVVVIQHANGLATAYAHDSSIAVSAGQSVSQGETIASVGCTGRCFGDHVHFEVRAGGSPVDPIGYL